MSSVQESNLSASLDLDQVQILVDLFNDDFAMIYEFIEGSEPILSNFTASEIEEEIGKLSGLSLNSSLGEKNAVHLDNCDWLIKDFEKCKNPEPEVFEYFVEQIKY